MSPATTMNSQEMRPKDPMVALHLMVKGKRDELSVPFKHHCDGFFEIQVEQKSEVVSRFPRIGKMKFTDHSTQLHQLRVTKGRVEVEV